MASASAEARLLLACASVGSENEINMAIRALLRGPLDWNAIRALAARHRVRPILYCRLLSADPQRVPPIILRELAEYASANARRNLFLTSQLLRLLDLLQSHNIAAAPFKGPMLAAGAYGNLGLREAGDLDLLVRRRDIVRARRLLGDHGFQPVFPTATPHEEKYLHSLSGRREQAYLVGHGEHHLVHPANQINVDLHWSLALREFWVLLNPDEPWRWLKPRTLAGRNVLGFGPEEMLLVLCINGAKDSWERLDRIRDIAELLRSQPDIIWELAYERARRAGARRMVGLGLRLARDLLNVEMPPGIASRLASEPALAAIFQRVVARLFTTLDEAAEMPGIGKSLLHLQLRERLADRIGYCLAHLEPTLGDWAAFPLPPRLSFLHYFLRPLRLAARFARARVRFRAGNRSVN